jgi:transposase
MIDIKTVYEIRCRKDMGHSARQIASDLKIGRATVKKYLENPTQVTFLRKSKASKLDNFKGKIKELLQFFPSASAARINEKIRKTGYDGSISILGRYLRTLRTDYRAYGKNISEMARMTGHSRNTIKKAMRDEAWGYKERSHQPFPVLEKYLTVIDGWLTGDKDMPKKQRHTARRVYNRLVDEYGYKGSEPAVRRYVRFTKMALGIDAPCAFIPYDPEVGHEGTEAQVYWAYSARIGDINSYCFFMVLSFSKMLFIKFFPSRSLENLLTGHLHAFHYFQGIPQKIHYNLKNVVLNIPGSNTQFNHKFLDFAACHLFTPHGYNARNLDEKGRVENDAYYVRNKFLAGRTFDSFIDCNQQAILWLDATANVRFHRTVKARVIDLFKEKEQPHMIPLPKA